MLYQENEENIKMTPDEAIETLISVNSVITNVVPLEDAGKRYFKELARLQVSYGNYTTR